MGEALRPLKFRVPTINRCWFAQLRLESKVLRLRVQELAGPMGGRLEMLLILIATALIACAPPRPKSVFVELSFESEAERDGVMRRWDTLGFPTRQEVDIKEVNIRYQESSTALVTVMTHKLAPTLSFEFVAKEDSTAGWRGALADFDLLCSVVGNSRRVDSYARVDAEISVRSRVETSLVPCVQRMLLE